MKIVNIEKLKKMKGDKKFIQDAQRNQKRNAINFVQRVIKKETMEKKKIDIIIKAKEIDLGLKKYTVKDLKQKDEFGWSVAHQLFFMNKNKWKNKIKDKKILKIKDNFNIKVKNLK